MRIFIILVLFITILFPGFLYSEDKINASVIINKINNNEDIRMENKHISGELLFTSLLCLEEKKTDEFGKKYFKGKIENSIIFNNCTFEEPLTAYFDNKEVRYSVVFNNTVAFRNCKFKNGVNFKLTRFKEDVDFSGSVFYNASFVRTLFMNNMTDFSKAELINADFTRAQFRGDAKFEDTHFNKVKFWLSEFRNTANFKKAEFADPFWLAYYTCTRDFSRVDFEGDKIFTETSLNGKPFNPAKTINFFDYMIIILPELVSGLGTTLIFTFVAMIIGFFLAIPMCTIRIYGKKPGVSSVMVLLLVIIGMVVFQAVIYAVFTSRKWSIFAFLISIIILGTTLTKLKGCANGFISGYVEIIRGTPLLIQLYMIYYGLPKILLPLGIRLSPYTAAMIGFIINSAAYQVEYMKGGFKAISYDQIEAAHSLGMRKWQTVYEILIPQGLRFSIPALSNELIYLMKYTSLAFIIQAPELMTRIKGLTSDYSRYMDTYLVAAFIYIILTFILTKITDFCDRKLRIPGFEPAKIR